MKTHIQYPPHKMQGEGYSGSITLTQYEHLQFIREQFQKEGFSVTMPIGN